jgi:hypothetical protein
VTERLEILERALAELHPAVVERDGDPHSGKATRPYYAPAKGLREEQG